MRGRAIRRLVGSDAPQAQRQPVASPECLPKERVALDVCPGHERRAGSPYPKSPALSSHSVNLIAS
jgi:hypothetical protein